MTHKEIQNEATKAGRANAVAAGRPEAPWMREDLDAANAVYHRLCRLHKVGMYGSEPMLAK